MKITEPKIAVNLHNNKEANFLKESRKGHREDAIKVLAATLSEEVISKCVEFIKNEFEIELSNEEFITIANLYPYQKAYLLIKNDVEESSVSNMIVNYFADTRMIQYGDTNNDEELQDEFYKMIKELANHFGYKTIENNK